MDTSIWSFIENKPAIIEIIPPGVVDPIVYNVAKNKTNIFNTSNLGMSNIGVLNDLPDGVYKVTIKGSPDSFCDALHWQISRVSIFMKVTNCHAIWPSILRCTQDQPLCR